MNPCCRSSRYGCALRTVHPSAANALVTAASTSACAGQQTLFADCRKSPLAIKTTSLALAATGAFIFGTQYVAIFHLLFPVWDRPDPPLRSCVVRIVGDRKSVV